MLLGWRPDEFWRSTPAELGSALDQFRPASEAPDASTLAELRKRFPDD